MVHLSTYMVIFWLCSCDEIVSGDVVKCEREGKPVENPEIGEWTPTLRLLRITDMTRKGDHPVPPEYLGFKNAALRMLLFDWLSGQWYSPLESVIARMEDPGRLFDSEWYCEEVPSILVMHDKCGRSDDPEVKPLLKALTLRKFHLNYNIFVMDFPSLLCKVPAMVEEAFYWLTKHESEFEFAHKKITEFFKIGFERNKIRPDQINMIGLGISTQLASEVAKSLQSRVKSIIGLDPDKDSVFPNVRKGDVELFQLYHTLPIQKGFFNVQQRVHFRITLRPDSPFCSHDEDIERCLHITCFHTFLGVILESHKFKAWKCNSLHRFERGKCKNQVVGLSYPPTPTPEGRYCLRISSSFPHGLGDDGCRFDSESIMSGKYDEGEGVGFDPTEFSFYTPDNILKRHSQGGY